MHVSPTPSEVGPSREPAGPRLRSSTRNRRPLSALASAAIAYLGLAAGLTSAAAAAPPIYVDGKPANVTAIVRHNQVFVPVRGVFEKLHAAVLYMPPRAVVARKAGADLARLTLGSRAVTVNGTVRTLEAAPFASGSHIFVPLRLISEAAGATVIYSAHPRAVRIAGAPAAAAPMAVGAPADVASPAPAPVAERQGIPWWVLLLLALVALGAIVAFLRRRKPDPIIVTRSSASDPNIRTRS